MVTKFNRKDKVEPLDVAELPDSYFQTSNQILAERDGKGLSKLRNRNDRIHSELLDLCLAKGFKLKTHKNGKRLWYVLEGSGISINLANS